VLSMLNKFVLGMALIRVLSGSLEIMAGLIMLKFNQVDKALVINSMLAVLGPLVLIVTTSIGLFGITSSISFNRLIWIMMGVGLILFGVLKK
jgi:hypothetical protein